MAEDSPRPPRPGRREGAEAVVDDDSVVRTYAERVRGCAEGRGGREHVRKGRRQLGDRVDIKALRAWDPSLLELTRGVAACARLARSARWLLELSF